MSETTRCTVTLRDGEGTTLVSWNATAIAWLPDRLEIEGTRLSGYSSPFTGTASYPLTSVLSLEVPAAL